jgi:hypothetical protein
MRKATGFCMGFCCLGKPRFWRVSMAGFQGGFGIGALPLIGRARFRHRGGIRASDLDTGIMLPVRWTRRAAPADPRTGRRSPPRPAGAFGAARLRRGRRTSPRPGRRAWSTRLLALFPIRAPRRKYASSDVLAFGTLAAGQAVAWAIPRMQADPLVGRSLTVLELRELVEQIEAAGLPRGLQIYMDGPSGPSSAAFMDG